jgi:hypothetical protein|tara:strand:- start:181 stop:462 length:282 start_codon:yes stop_codon:yes gene_type:complete
MELYFVKSMGPADPPDGGGKGPWWKYEIGCAVPSNESIFGIRGGSKEDIEGYLERMLVSINERTMGHQSEKMRAAHRSPKSIPANLPTLRGRR